MSGTSRRLRTSGAAAATLLAAACATTTQMPADYRWFYRDSYGAAGAAGEPIALYGPPETSALYVFECHSAARAIGIVSVDVEPFEGSRPLGLRVGRARWSGEERMSDGDGQELSRAMVPLDHPVLDEIAAGRGPIRIVHPQGVAPLPAGEPPARVVGECRRRSASL